MVERRYGILWLIVVVLKVLAWLVLVAGIIFTVIAVGQGDMRGGMHGMPPGPLGMGGAMLGGVFPLIAAVFYFIMLYAWAEGILVMLAIEENTRATAERLARQSPPQ